MNLEQIKQANNFLYSSILCETKQEIDTFSSVSCLKNLLALLSSPVSKNYNNPFAKIHEFFNAIDLNHKGLSGFLETVFTPAFFQKCHEINSIIQFCEEKAFSLKKDLTSLSKVIIDEIQPDFLNFVGNPEVTKVYTRFLPEKTRWLSRTNKKNQSIHIKNNTTISSSSNIFNIENYYHNSNLIDNLKDDLQNKKDVMYKMGCTNISKEICSTIKSIEESISLKRHGFQRVTISKLLRCLSDYVHCDAINVKPITYMESLSGTDAYKFIRLCEAFPHGKDWQGPIFDHYAELTWKNAEFTILIGEIDTRSYFISYIIEE